MSFKRRLRRLEGGGPKEPQRSKVAREISEIDREIARLEKEIALEAALMSPDELAEARDAAEDLDARLDGLTTDEKIALLEEEISEQERE